jgi:hypothetical protein
LIASRNHPLSCLEPGHELIPDPRRLCGVAGCAPEHGPRHPFHGTMVLFHEIMQIFHLADDAGGPVCLVVAFEGRFMGLTPVTGARVRAPVPAARWRQQAPRGLKISVPREETVTGLPGLLDGPLPGAPCALHREGGLVHAPAAPHRALAAGAGLLQAGAGLQDPALEGHVLDGPPALLHEGFDMPLA